MTRSKFVWLLALAIVLGTGAGCKKPNAEKVPRTETPKQTDNVLASFHFVGFELLNEDTNAAPWTEMEALPATRALEAHVLAKLAAWPYQFLHHRINWTSDNFTNLIRPLLEDLIRAESFAELRAPEGKSPEFALAVRLGGNRAMVWRTNLATILSAWTTIKACEFGDERAGGWELRKHHHPNLVRFEQVGDWAVWGWGDQKLDLQERWAGQIRKTGRPKDPETVGWLEVRLNWPRLQPILERQLAVTLPGGLPEMHLVLTNKGDNLRSMVDFVFAKPLDWSPEPWTIPTNTIREPIISFAACQGVAPLLGRVKAFQELGIEPVPNQFYLWALAQVPLQTFLAARVDDPTNVLARLGPNIEAFFQTNLQERMVGTIKWLTNDNTVVWQGLPFIVPFIQPLTEPNGQFLFAGMFPNVSEVNPPPPELLAQIEGRTNLVYYEWEITQARMEQLWHLSQLFRLLAQRRQLETNEPAPAWLFAVAPKLGNTVTEVTVTGPNRLSLLRKSPIGFTAFELISLANWIESSKFPLGGLCLPKRPPAGQTNPPPPSSNAPSGRQH